MNRRRRGRRQTTPSSTPAAIGAMAHDHLAGAVSPLKPVGADCSSDSTIDEVHDIPQ